MTRELTDQTLQKLHDLAWSCYRLEVYVSLAVSVQQEEVKRINGPLALECLLQDMAALVEDVVNVLDDLQNDLAVTFPRDGWRENPIAIAKCTEQEGVD